VVGAGTAGCTVSAKLAYRYGANNVTVLESADVSQSRSNATGVYKNIFSFRNIIISLYGLSSEVA
jgi:glycine/D-amino acid oxidase-like deaminating enzyme